LGQEDHHVLPAKGSYKNTFRVKPSFTLFIGFPFLCNCRIKNVFFTVNDNMKQTSECSYKNRSTQETDQLHVSPSYKKQSTVMQLPNCHVSTRPCDETGLLPSCFCDGQVADFGLVKTLYLFHIS